MFTFYKKRGVNNNALEDSAKTLILPQKKYIPKKWLFPLMCSFCTLLGLELCIKLSMKKIVIISDLFNLQKNMPLFGYMIPKKWLVFFTEKIKSDASKIKLLGISQTKYCMIKDAVTFFFCVVQGNCIVLLCNVGFHPSFVKAAFLVLVILENLRQLFLFLFFFNF